MQTFSDEYIEHWGNEFEARELWRYGVLFEAFLNYPREILDAVSRRSRPLFASTRRFGAEADVSHVNMEVAQ
ncbi:MAG: hypothetical protein HY272_01850 [Gammaproteobacteria bacterium]|nr:hypothetical protein [Gammaproteobacteria bacterium]